MKDAEMCFYVPGARHVQDGARLDYIGQHVGQYSGETWAEMAARVPGVTLCPFDDAVTQTAAVREAALCHGPEEITEARYTEMLNVLPPCKWAGHRGGQAFFVSEAIDADIHSWFVKIGSRHWTLNRSRARTTASVIDEVLESCGTQPDPSAAKLVSEVAEMLEEHGDAFFDEGNAQ